MSKRLILPLPGNEASASSLAHAGDWELGKIETRRFPYGETYLRVLWDVRGREVDLVWTLADPDPLALPLLFATDALRDLGAVRITLVAPYLAYVRQDRRFQEGEAVTSLSFARLPSRAFDRLVTVDPHLHRHPKLASLYDIPADALHAAPLLAEWIGAQVPEPLVIGPDEESGQWVSDIAGRIGAPWATFRKERHGDRSVELTAPDLSAWRSCQPVLVDDIASSGRTLLKAAALLPSFGFPPPVCLVVQAIFADNAFRDLAAVTARVVSTEAVPHPSNAIALAPLISQPCPDRRSRSMLTFTSFGAAGTVTGSKHMLELDGRRMLVDCGLFQGLKNLRELNWAPFPVDPISIDLVVLTHAYVDHSGYLPRLIHQGFQGPILRTPATRDVAGLILKDAARLQETEAKDANCQDTARHRPALSLYDERDVQAALGHFTPVPFDTTLPLENGAELIFRHAGHILGAATAEIRWGGRTTLFSGDLGRYDDPMLPDPVAGTEADIVVIESTYGNRPRRRRTAWPAWSRAAWRAAAR